MNGRTGLLLPHLRLRFERRLIFTKAVGLGMAAVSSQRPTLPPDAGAATGPIVVPRRLLALGLSCAAAAFSAVNAPRTTATVTEFAMFALSGLALY